MGVTVRAGNGHSHGGRRRWNANVPMVVILAMLCGSGLLLGLIGLQRIKERRDLDRLIKEKDGQILSLHLLLQKEKDQSQEIKKKAEDMRTKMYNLLARNTDLNARISDMESTISSLRDEQRAIELHLHESRNEAMSALTEISRRKESEIMDLKNHLRSCAETKNEPPIAKANQTAITYDEEGSNNGKDNALPFMRNNSMLSEEESEIGEQMDKEKNDYENDQEPRPREDNSKTNFTQIEEFSTKEDNAIADLGKISSFNQENARVDGFRFRGKRAFLKMSTGKRLKKKIEEVIELGNNHDSSMQATEVNPAHIIKTENSTKTEDTENMKEAEVSDFDNMSEHKSGSRDGIEEVSGTTEDDVQTDDFPEI